MDPDGNKIWINIPTIPRWLQATGLAVVITVGMIYVGVQPEQAAAKPVEPVVIETNKPASALARTWYEKCHLWTVLGRSEEQIRNAVVAFEVDSTLPQNDLDQVTLACAKGERHLVGPEPTESTVSGPTDRSDAASRPADGQLSPVFESVVTTVDRRLLAVFD